MARNKGERMNREIKFRVYISKYKILDTPDIINFNTQEVKYDSDYYSLDDIELMQYTGIKDKNGKEIYEGDILRYSFPYDRRLRHISPVSYLDTQASFGIKDIYGNEIPLYRITANNYFEVVGNIYENPELLEEKNG